MSTIERLKALEAAATEGPWQTSQWGEVQPRGANGGMNWIRVEGFSLSSGIVPRANRDLLVAFRNLAPQILAVMEAAEAYDNPKNYTEGTIFPLRDALSAFHAAAKEQGL